ncbi:hypothetical protein MHLP_01955 [Candidatus Mycoplasma haematolamae str. Purdue]|uniref:Uncharacterized protein n=1 Tax=Mycoplasma haematolamae (strain Purdue) TaxID=1212765 RepID=I7CFJ0_MYCHA|nr:hypothetical protein [Candidatus Mycoplasma haematolamae]AFO51971.1 hypothetical protein MHLP_01955 [Candidatus Mycoplasma haematolamae str. Purdue]
MKTIVKACLSASSISVISVAAGSSYYAYSVIPPKARFLVYLVLTRDDSKAKPFYRGEVLSGEEHDLDQYEWEVKAREEEEDSEENRVDPTARVTLQITDSLKTREELKSYLDEVFNPQVGDTSEELDDLIKNLGQLKSSFEGQFGPNSYARLIERISEARRKANELMAEIFREQLAVSFKKLRNS